MIKAALFPMRAGSFLMTTAGGFLMTTAENFLMITAENFLMITAESFLMRGVFPTKAPCLTRKATGHPRGSCRLMRTAQRRVRACPDCDGEYIDASVDRPLAISTTLVCSLGAPHPFVIHTSTVGTSYST